MSQALRGHSAMIALESRTESPPKRPDGPVWELALLFPDQGHWTEQEYLALRTNRLVELADGSIEVHPVATFFHQFIIQYLFKLLDEFVRSRRLGAVVIAPSPIRLAPNRLREP